MPLSLSPTTVDEGSSVAVSVSTTNVAQGTRLCWRSSVTGVTSFSAATLPWLSTQPAAAVSITVDGQADAIFAVSGKPAENLSDFAAFPGGKMPWWGNPMKASKFAKDLLQASMVQHPTMGRCSPMRSAAPI